MSGGKPVITGGDVSANSNETEANAQHSPLAVQSDCIVGNIDTNDRQSTQ
ncbi:MAG: hypothetical protein IPJ39_19735 [Saprospiraceae bacterium]|nr:hypothetical protein [Saprospiraceae bacterium]